MLLQLLHHQRVTLHLHNGSDVTGYFLGIEEGYVWLSNHPPAHGQPMPPVSAFDRDEVWSITQPKEK